MDTSNFALLLKFTTNTQRDDDAAIKGIENGFINPHIKDQVLKVLNHFDKFARFDVSGQTEDEINTNLKGLYKAIFEFKVANAESKIDNARVVDFMVAKHRNDKKPLRQIVQFGKWVDKIIQTGIARSDNEDIRHLATLSKAAGTSSIKVEGNTDTDLLIALHGIVSENENQIDLPSGTGFKMTFGRNGDSVKVLSSKFGSADKEGIYTLDYEDPEIIEQFGLDDNFEMKAQESEAGIAMSTFEGLILNAIEDGSIDPFDLDNVTIEVKK